MKKRRSVMRVSGRRRGIALITGLLVSVFCLILGLAFLTFIDRDVFFAGAQQAGMEAYFLAQCGIEYFRVTGEPVAPPPSSTTIQVPVGNPQRTATVEKRLSGDLVFTGRVLGGGGTVRAERVIIAPGGNLANVYEK